MKKLLWLIFSGLIPLGLLCLILYLFDPLQIYHKPYFRTTIFNSNMHYQASGIINNYTFDSLILGSSILVNTSSNEATKKLGGQWVNLSVSGGGIDERIDILKYALWKKQIKQIIFSLEPGWLQEEEKENRYAYLYDDNRFNDFKTYLDENFIFCLLIPKICLKGEKTLDRPSQWITQDWVQNLLGGFDSWIENKNRPDIKNILKQIQNFHFQQQKYSQNQQVPQKLITIIKENPQITFNLIIPPFSRLSYKLSNIDIKDAIQKILDLKVSNVRIFGFDNTELPDHLEHYIDLVHYDDTINSFILNSIKNNTHQITSQNIHSYFQTMQEKIKTFDLNPLKQKILTLDPNKD